MVRRSAVPRRLCDLGCVALATDGERLWFALEGKGGHHLIAREAKLRKQGSTLLLDVPTPSRMTAVLKFDGTRFVQLN